jgi:hypothetical protein
MPKPAKATQKAKQVTGVQLLYNVFPLEPKTIDLLPEILPFKQVYSQEKGKKEVS